LHASFFAWAFLGSQNDDFVFSVVREHLGEIYFLCVSRHIPSDCVNVDVILELWTYVALAQSLLGIQLLLIMFVTLSLLQKLVCLVNIVKINFPLQTALQSQDELPIFISA